MIYAQESLFYIGTYTKDPLQGGIWMSRLNLESGELSPPELAVAASNPSFLTLAPHSPQLFAVEENQEGTVCSYLRQSDGKLTFVNRQPSGGNGSCHVEIDRLGKTLFTANYSSGTIASFPILENHSIGAPIQTFDFLKLFSPSDPTVKSHAHGNYMDASNQFLYSCDLGTDTVGIFRFDAEKQTLTPLPSHAKLPLKSGPRHLVIHSSGKWIYVNTEMGLTIEVFERNLENGSLRQTQKIPLLPLGINITGKVSSAEILCHPSGHWIYVSIRGYDSISVFAVGNDGKLSLIENIPSIVKFPRGMTIDPSGRWLLAAGQKDHRITPFKIDPTTGKLLPTDKFINVESPVCMVFTDQK
jgi:6-phosphogluconolactonase